MIAKESRPIDRQLLLCTIVIIMDISMRDLNGTEATRQITSNSPHVKVLILSLYSGQRFMTEVFKAGASGYLLKDCDFSEVFAAIVKN